MAQIAANFWSGIWASGDQTGQDERREYVEEFGKQIDPGLAPGLPSVEDFHEAIRKTKDSAAGPDGIPFAAYRKLRDTAATHCAETNLSRPRKRRAASTRFQPRAPLLLPKNDSGLVQDTRPLGVNNCDNRIIARVMNCTIHPAVEDLIGPEQQGFLPGRLIDNHVMGLNEEFYGAIQRKDKRLIIFLDNVKAFDSISHDFLFRILEWAGLPRWVTLFVRGLFHWAEVEPSFGQKGRYRIPISRGVKQGCPLSLSNLSRIFGFAHSLMTSPSHG